MNCIVLAGGKSSRMKDELGIDKAFLPFGTYSTLWEWQNSKLLKIFDSVYFSSKNTAFPSILDDVKTINGQDISSTYAPMVGFYSALCKFDEAFFIAVDTPFFGEEQINQLLEVANKNKNADAIIASSNGKAHPTIAIYRNSILASLGEHIVQNKLKLMLFLSTLNCITVEFDEKFTANINDKKGYESACLLI